MAKIEIDLNVDGFEDIQRVLNTLKELNISSAKLGSAFDALRKQQKQSSQEIINQIKEEAALDDAIAKQKKSNAAIVIANSAKERSEIDLRIGKKKEETAENTRQASVQSKITAEIRKQNAGLVLDSTEILRKNRLIAQSTAENKNETSKLTKAKEEERLANEKLRGSLLQNRLERDNGNESLRKSNALTNTLSGSLRVLAGALALDSLSDFARGIFEAQSKLEAFELSMGNVIGKRYGQQLFEDLKKFTIESPLDFADTIQQSQALVNSMVAVGKSSKQISQETIPILESLGNTASALGGGDRLGRLVYAFTQVQAAGKLMGTELRQINEVGVPMLALLSEQSGKSVAQIRKDISDGKVSFTEFKEAILSVGQAGGVFAGSMDIMANTVTGRFNRLKEVIFTSMANIGEVMAASTKRFIDYGAALVQTFFGTEEATRSTLNFVKVLVSLGAVYLVNEIRLKAMIALKSLYTTVTTAARIATALYNGELTISEIKAEMAAIATAKQSLATGTLTGTQRVAAVATAGQTLATEGLTVAQQAAIVSSRAFNLALGAIAIALTAAYYLYQKYQQGVDGAEERTRELNKTMTLATADIVKQQSEVNRLSNEILKKNFSAEQELKIMERLKATHPTLLKGVQNLSEAEKILNANHIKSNEQLKYREFQFNILKEKYPLIMADIDKLAGNEEKLARRIREVNGEFKIQARIAVNTALITRQAQDQAEALVKVASITSKINALKKEGAEYTGTGGALLVGEVKKLEEAKKAWLDVYQKIGKANESFYIQNEELSSKIKYTREEEARHDINLESSKNKAKGDSHKEFIKSSIQRNLEAQLTEKKINEKTFQDKLDVLKLEADIEIEEARTKIKNQKVLADKIAEINNNLRVKLDDIRDKQELEEKERKDRALKAEKEHNNKLKSETEKAEEEIAKIKQNIREIDLELQEQQQLDSELSLAKSEKEKIAILRKYAKKRYDEKVAAIMKEISMKELELLGKKEIEAIFGNPKEAELASKNLEKEILILREKLSKLTAEYYKEDKSIKETASKDEIKLSEQTNKKIIKTKEESTKAIISLTKLAIRNTLDALDGFDTESTNRFSRQLKIVEKGLNDIGNQYEQFSSKISELRTKNNSDDDKSNDVASGLLGGLTALGASNPLALIEGIVNIVNTGIDTIGNAVSYIQTRNNERIISNNKKMLAQLKADYDVATKLIQDTLNEQLRIISDAKTAEVKVVSDTEAQKISDLIENKALLAQINSDFQEDEARIYALYNESLTSNDKQRASEAKEIVDKLLQDLRDARNKNIENVYLAQQKEKDIIQKANDEIAEINKNADNKTREELDKLIADVINKREEDINNLYDYNQRVININKEADDAILEIQKTSNQRTVEENQALIDKINEQRNADLNSEKAKLDALSIIKQDSAIRLNEIDEESKAKEVNAKLAADEAKRASEKAYQENVYKYELASFNANKEMQLALLKVEKAKALAKFFTLGLFGLGAGLSIKPLSDAIDEISNLAPPPPPSFKKGTDDTSKDAIGKHRVDKDGGFKAILHPKEAVFTKEQMEEMTIANNGKRPTRDEVVNRFKSYINVNTNIEPLKINPFVIQKIQSDIDIKGFNRLSKDIARLEQTILNKKETHISIDKSGLRTVVKSVNSVIEKKNKKFAS